MMSMSSDTESHGSWVVAGTIVGSVSLLSLLTGALCLHRIFRRRKDSTDGDNPLERGHIRNLSVTENIYDSVPKLDGANNGSPTFIRENTEERNANSNNCAVRAASVSSSAPGASRSSKNAEPGISIQKSSSVRRKTGDARLLNDVASSTVDAPEHHHIDARRTGSARGSRGSTRGNGAKSRSSDLDSSAKGPNHDISTGVEISDSGEHTSSRGDLYQSVDICGSDDGETGRSPPSMEDPSVSHGGINRSSNVSQTIPQVDRLEITDLEEDYYQSVDNVNEMDNGKGIANEEAGNTSEFRSSFPKYSVVRKKRKESTETEVPVNKDRESVVEDDYYSTVDNVGGTSVNPTGVNSNNNKGSLRVDLHGNCTGDEDGSGEQDEYYASVDMPRRGRCSVDENKGNILQANKYTRNSQTTHNDQNRQSLIDDYYQSVDATDIKGDSLSTQESPNIEDDYYQSVDIREVSRTSAHNELQLKPSVRASQETQSRQFQEEANKNGSNNPQGIRNPGISSCLEEDYQSIDMVGDADQKVTGRVESFYSEIDNTGAKAQVQTPGLKSKIHLPGNSSTDRTKADDGHEDQKKPFPVYAVVKKKRKPSGNAPKTEAAGLEKEEIRKDKLTVKVSMPDTRDCNKNIRKSLNKRDSNSDTNRTGSHGSKGNSSADWIYQDVDSEPTKAMAADLLPNIPDKRHSSGDDIRQCNNQGQSLVSPVKDDIGEVNLPAVNNKTSSDNPVQTPEDDDYDHLLIRPLSDDGRRKSERHTALEEEDDYSHI